jgi:hypothetical protein
VHSWILQIAVTAAAVVYLGRWRFRLRQRRRRSLDELLARLIPGWQAPAAGESANAKAGPTLRQADNPARLRDLYRNAQTMQEIADYALRNIEALDRQSGRGIDPAIVEELHRDATYLRFRALGELVRFGFGKR